MIICVDVIVIVVAVCTISQNVSVWVMVHPFVICLYAVFLIVLAKIVIKSVSHMMS